MKFRAVKEFSAILAFAAVISLPTFSHSGHILVSYRNQSALEQQAE